MAQNIQQQIDALETQVADLAVQVAALTAALATQSIGNTTDGAAQQMPPPSPRGMSSERWRMLREATEDIAAKAQRHGVRGLVQYGGSFVGNEGREYRWKLERTTDTLLGQDKDGAARALAALGNRQRLALLIAILETPGSATELMERTGLTSAGQTYHHLNTLVAAGLIRSAERGQFAFVGHQAPAFFMLLTGVWDMLDSQYGTGSWEGGELATADENAVTEMSGEPFSPPV